MRSRRRRHRHVVILVIVTLGLSAGSLNATAPQPEGRIDPMDLESYIDGVMAEQLETAKMAGAVVAVVERGEILLAKGYGSADVEQKVPVDGATTLFRPGSISKLFTYTAILQLVERQGLDLDADVNDYLTTYEVHNGYPEPITLRHLITHTTPIGSASLSGSAMAKFMIAHLQDRHTRTFPRFHHSIVLIAGLAMVWLTNYYNLLGFRY
jgi:CubicO group peptidase (beta-lactamase class C family)